MHWVYEKVILPSRIHQIHNHTEMPASLDRTKNPHVSVHKTPRPVLSAGVFELLQHSTRFHDILIDFNM